MLNFRPDTSEYPASHSLFCYTPDGDVSAKLQRIIDEISEEPPRPLGCAIRTFVHSVARVVSATASKVVASTLDEVTDEEEANSDGEDDFDAFDFDDDVPPESNLNMIKVQEYVNAPFVFVIPFNILSTGHSSTS